MRAPFLVRRRRMSEQSAGESDSAFRAEITIEAGNRHGERDMPEFARMIDARLAADARHHG